MLWKAAQGGPNALAFPSYPDRAVASQGGVEGSGGVRVAPPRDEDSAPSHGTTRDHQGAALGGNSTKPMRSITETSGFLNMHPYRSSEV